MGDGSQNDLQLAEEQYRVSTYGNREFPLDKHALAKSGFYYTQKGNYVKCFKCNLEIDAANASTTEIDRYHKDRFPSCFGTDVADCPQNRSKKFISYDSLRFEKERLETFIEWPVSWLKPVELAHDGFYYLRTADHCACVFCRGIVGAWEKGDTPRGEHQRHFPHCPFVKGQPVGNIPLEHSHIISRLSPRSDTSRTPNFNNVDVCGTSRLMSGSYPEKTGPPNKNCLNLDGMGLPVHSGPKRRDYLTYESRLTSFVRWPDLVKQKPAELAEAGFFYCGLSDHVRCFHCGNGLRNWESDDQPWDEHARWYPECNFVLLKKGQEFIDQVRRERPPYIRSQPSTKSGASNVPSTAATSSVRPAVSDTELDPLMELDIIRAVLVMGFPTDKVRAALRRKLEQTGLPFFSLEPCIEAVLQYMEEETRQTLHQRSSQDIDDEATEQQAAKMEVLRPGNTNPTEAATVTSEPSTSSATNTAPVVSPPEATSVVSHSHTTPASSASSASLSSSSVSPLSSLSSPQEVSSLPSSASTSGQVSATTSPVSSLSSPRQGLALPEVPASTTTEMSQQSPAVQHEAMDVDEPPSPLTFIQPIDLITQANEVIGMAKKALKPPSSGPPSLENIQGKIEGPATSGLLEDAPSTSGGKKVLRSVGGQSSKELADELEKIRDSRMCKVCMDADMDVVFLPCSHMVTCASCALALAQCPICRLDIKYTIKPILS